ncbi:MAG: class II aldolase/adducin family protein [Lachnospiraceae bacterium]|nr:class II aldolase/adducin family protein [Lachnospiraceae bacterium]
MDNNKRANIIKVGRELLAEGLVARTWGNISAREDDDNYLITPSGLDYITMTNDDIVLVNITTGKWTNVNRPSGERAVHKAAYEVFPEVNFVVHTHQTYATAIGLAGFDTLDITPEEKERLGGIGLAEYGMPSSDKLTNAVTGALKAGNHVVLMLHHGVLVCGTDKDDAMERVRLLEKICYRNVCKTAQNDKFTIEQTEYDNIKIVRSDDIRSLADKGRAIISQLDDISQMVGEKIEVTDISSINEALEDTTAVLVKGVGAAIKAEDEDDFEALAVLMQKMAVVKNYTERLSVDITISLDESRMMHDNYVNNYSKQKKQK